MVKEDGSVLIHADGGSYKPLNWMSPPCTLIEEPTTKGLLEATEPGREFHHYAEHEPDRVWTVTNRAGETLRIHILEVLHDYTRSLGPDPGLVKDGVEAHLQELLAQHVETLGVGWTLVRREYPTAIGPVDLLCRSESAGAFAVEIKRRGEIGGVEQLIRYLDLLNRDPTLAPVGGILAAQEIKPQARTVAEDRGIRCVTLDYDALRGRDDASLRLF